MSRLNKFDKETVVRANKALAENDHRSFFEAFGLQVYETPEDNDVELSGYTDGGVNMVFSVKRRKWKEDMVEYAENFDIDEEIRLMRQDPSGSYCKAFTLENSVRDYKAWDEWVTEIARLIEADGKYRYHDERADDDYGRVCAGRNFVKVMLFSKERYDRETLDGKTHGELWELYRSDSSGIFVFDTVWQYQYAANKGTYGTDKYLVYFVLQ